MAETSPWSFGRALPGLLIGATLTAAVALLAIAVTTGVRRLAPAYPEVDGPETRQVSPRATLSGLELSTIALFESAAPGVVHISTSSGRVRWFESLGRGRDWEEGSGSGFVWDLEGHIVTNHHVVEGAQTLVVTFADGRRYPARLMGVSTRLDLAVLEVDAPGEGLRPLPLGSSADLSVGQVLYAIGSPFGLDQTLSAGLLGGLERTVRDDRGRLLTGMIQTDAAIHPGNSGGPLLDSAGRVIGIATAVVESPGGNGGIGFAIPIDVVNRTLPKLMSEQQVGPVAIGLVIGRPALLQTLGLAKGLPIGEVVSGSPSERAGLRGLDIAPDGHITADVLLSLSGVELGSRDDLMMVLHDFAPGDLITARVWREGQVFEVEL
ncbi:MAG: trypsin-like peptidase domain-containing protein, partial [Planctomycetota bacterium]